MRAEAIRERERTPLCQHPVEPGHPSGLSVRGYIDPLLGSLPQALERTAIGCSVNMVRRSRFRRCSRVPERDVVNSNGSQLCAGLSALDRTEVDGVLRACSGESLPKRAGRTCYRQSVQRRTGSDADGAARVRALRRPLSI